MMREGRRGREAMRWDAMGCEAMRCNAPVKKREVRRSGTVLNLIDDEMTNLASRG